MNPQQQRMAAIGTDKELSDLLDFSAVGELSSASWGSAAVSRDSELGRKGGKRHGSGQLHLLFSDTPEGWSPAPPSWTPEL